MYKIEITPKSNPFHLHLKDIWQFRDLVLMFVNRDFIAVYKQTILGPIWFFLQPLITTIVFSLVFGTIGELTPFGVPVFLYYLSGIILWNYFSDCLIKTSGTFIDNQDIFGKVYFPRLVIPISIILSNLIKFGVQFFLFLIIFLWFYIKGKIEIQLTILLFPLLLLLMAMLGMGIGILISALTTKYRDLRFLVQFGVQLLMYLTPGIILSYDLITQKIPKFIWLVNFNPIYPIIESFKHGWLSAGTFNWYSLLTSVTITFITFILGIFTFNKTEQNFMDTV